MKNTNIQWCHSTINPVMGCNGCELWPSPSNVANKVTAAMLAAEPEVPSSAEVRAAVSSAIGDRATSELYSDRDLIAGGLIAKFGLNKSARVAIVDAIRTASKCYAGQLGTMRGGHKGYADRFEHPKLFPGRMEIASRWSPPTDLEKACKPWLLDAPRMIFVSDMGDALSREVPFEYLRQEIIANVTSDSGRQHLWLWLSKRPARMAEFGRWLSERGISWPDNLVAMTTVTSQATSGRISELRKVPSKFKGLSCEPIFTELNLDLSGIDWLIAGGGSDVLAEPFQIEWALKLRDQCSKTGTAFFLKQLGKHPTFNGQPVELMDRHGSEWSEWLEEWRIREIPAGFRSNSTI